MDYNVVYNIIKEMDPYYNIFNGKLIRYTGHSKFASIPETVTIIGNGAFSECDSLTNITIPNSVTTIGERAFQGCTSLKSITIPDSVTTIGGSAFRGCDKLTSITISNSVTTIGKGAFSCCTSLTSITIPDSVTAIGERAFEYCNQLESVIFLGRTLPIDKYDKHVFSECNHLSTLIWPNMLFASIKEMGFGMLAAKGFIREFQQYKDPTIVADYIAYISSQRKKLLPDVFAIDSVEILKLLADAKKITKKNLEQDYMLLAEQYKAEKCVSFLEQLAECLGSTAKEVVAQNMEGRELWDGIHFSLDGKILLKYKEEPGRTVYEVPSGTTVIAAEAFYGTSLKAIRLPETVYAIRERAFHVDEGSFLCIYLPASLKRMPRAATCGWGTRCIVSGNIDIINHVCESSDDYGIYTGGTLEELNPRVKTNAVRGFIYAIEYNLADMTPWRKDYIKYIRRNEKTFVKRAEEDDYLLRFMVDEKLISEKNVIYLLDALGKQSRTELTAILLEYRSIQFGSTKDELSFSDNDPELKRMIKMEERREQIKNQKGIKGLTFVATGDLDYFGWKDEYTGEHDLYDLKEFIEEQGGHLRSAVSSKTDYLICNDLNSETVKSKKAKELGVSVITEEEFLRIDYSGTREPSVRFGRSHSSGL